MRIEELLGIDLDNPGQVLAIAQVQSDSGLLDELIQIRVRRGLTQTDMAARLGVSQSAVARFESGDRDPRLSTLGRYAHALGVLIRHRVDRREDGEPLRPTCGRGVTWPYESHPTHRVWVDKSVPAHA